MSTAFIAERPSSTVGMIGQALFVGQQDLRPVRTGRACPDLLANVGMPGPWF